MRRALVVDDSETMREILTSALADLDEPVEVTQVASGFEALRSLARQTFDLVVTDVNMPDINGLELAAFVRRDAQHRGVPLLIVSSEGSSRDREKGLELGADAYLVKPFDPDELRDLARELLARDSSA